MNRTPQSGIGLMCGTSHDGLDLAHVKFWQENNNWRHQVIETAEVSLPHDLKRRLDQATTLSGLELATLDHDFARFSAQTVIDSAKTNQIQADFIASHGVTVFHDPEKGLTTQIGSGAIISAITGLKTVADFRSQDVAKAGQGAPLVPFADKHLFSEFDFTLNLGGFANLSDLRSDQVLGFDTSPCNLILNHLANKEGLSHDRGGDLARQGNLDKDLLSKLNALDYYTNAPPKSLGYEWFSEHVLPLLSQKTSNQDLLHTAAEHIAMQIGKNLDSSGRCLITGGGAFNDYLVERIQHFSLSEIVVPSPETINFKEAICFAFLGLMRLLEQPNVSKQVTGAIDNSIAGAVYLP